MMVSDSYQDFAARYDWMISDDPVRKAFFQQLFKSHNVSNVLDCACGTGADLLMFHDLGYKVVGSDLSEAMLDQAQTRLQKAGVDLPIQKADFRQLEQYSSEKFDSVVCLTNAINEVLDESGVRAALKSMRSMLRPGGILIFDQGQSDLMMREKPRFEPVLNNRDYSRVFALEYSGQVMRVNVLDLIHDGLKNEFYASKFDIAIRLKDDWDRLLDGIGFSDIQYYGDYEFNDYDKESSHMLLVVARN